MNEKRIIEKLEYDWDEGVFHKLRQGSFEPSEGFALVDEYRKILVFEDDSVPKRIVSLIWYIPQFLDWQVGRVENKGGDLEAYEKFRNTMLSLLEEILGVP